MRSWTKSTYSKMLARVALCRLGRAVRTVGMERMEDMGTYSTTFWLPAGTKPTNVVEESVSLLFTVVQPGPECIGMEWWLGRLKRGESLPFHTEPRPKPEKRDGADCPPAVVKHTVFGLKEP